MKRRQLQKWFRKHGCEMVRRGSNHEVWQGPGGGQSVLTYGHTSRELKRGTVVNTCLQMEIPVP